MCTAKAQSSSGRIGGLAFRKSFYKPPSWQAANRRSVRKNALKAMKAMKVMKAMKAIKAIKAMKAILKKRVSPAVAAQQSVTKKKYVCQGIHRWCFRCEQRMDHCRRAGCLPYKFPVAEAKLARFIQRFDDVHGKVRYTSDCWDVQIAKHWAAAARTSYGIRVAMIGLIVIAHFKSIRTWGAINGAFKKQVDWCQLKACLVKCGELWGGVTSHAIYSGSNMSGSGMPAHGKTFHDKFPHFFRLVKESEPFNNACDIVTKGVDDFSTAKKLDTELQRVRKLVPGLLGDYHFKMLIDFMVACNFLPAGWVLTYPVCSKGGTATGLRELYNVKGKGVGVKTLEDMLQEVTHRVLIRSTSWWASDHHGTVGAALCWEERKGKPASCAKYESRFDETSTALWESELEQLAEHSFTIFGYHG